MSPYQQAYSARLGQMLWWTCLCHLVGGVIDFGRVAALSSNILLFQ